MNDKDLSITRNIALFVDVENLVRLAYDNGLPVDLEPVVTKLSEDGRVTIRRAYGDLYAACQGNGKSIGEIRKMLQQNFVQFEDIPFINKHKNMADMRLAIEALSLAYSYENISNFAIVSSDKDYMPLISKLRELGKYITGIGANPDLVNKVYVSSCDEFIYYSTLFARSFTHGEAIVGQFDRDGLLDQYMVLLCKALSVLDERGGKTVAAAIAPLMKRMRPDFDLTLVGLSNFRELANLAEGQGLIAKEQHGGDILLRLAASADEFKKMQQSIYEFKADNLDSAVLAYKNYFENKLKCRIPTKAQRESIYDHTVKIIITTCSKDMPKGLVEISNEVEVPLFAFWTYSGH